VKIGTVPVFPVQRRKLLTSYVSCFLVFCLVYRTAVSRYLSLRCIYIKHTFSRYVLTPGIHRLLDCSSDLLTLIDFYCAMHVVRYCYPKLSVRLSICPSVTLMYRGHLGWTSLKLIKQIISLGSSLLGAITSAISPKGNTPKFGLNRRWVALLSIKPAISLTHGKIGPRLLLATNRKIRGAKINDLG